MQVFNKKRLLLLAVVLSALLLCGCGVKKTSRDEEAVRVSAATATPSPTATPVPTVDIGGTDVRADTQSLDLTALDYIFDVLIENSPSLQSVREINLGLIGKRFA